MRETRNQKGITLIALIVTIIVLIIIAGISIATLTSDNGVIRGVNTAKVTQIEATAREQMDLACSAMRIAIAEAAAQDNSYKANENAAAIQTELYDVLYGDTTALEAEGWKKGTVNGATFTMTYEGDDYKNACNDDSAKITYTITLAQRSIEVTDVATGIKDSTGNDISIDIGAGSGSSIPVTPPSDAGSYLVDQVEIGDYVDIGISYTNYTSPSTSYLSGTNTAMTGWRVLSKSGSGADGTVTLVSAGAPLSFYHPSGGVSQSSIDDYLSNLNTEITVVTSGHGFIANGFSSSNLASVWASNNKINGATAHAMTTTEVETAYAALTGTSKTISELNSTSYALRTSNMITVNTGMSTKAYDLLGCGITYWLGGSSYNTRFLGLVYGNGFVTITNGSTYGVRPVVSLNSGVQIAGDNTGTGADVSTAYTLAE